MFIEKIKEANKLKLGFGLASFIISFIFYMLTVAPTVSFWDCGEFIACAHTMAVPHPPGAPMFLLIARMFSMIPFNADVAYRTNILSVLSSAASIIFLYYSIILLIRRMRGYEKNARGQFLVFFSAFLGAMTFAFTDSHWFNAVETEVYGMSTMLTAITAWLILKWDAEDIRARHAEKYLLFLFYIIGIGVGIHLLNILVIPFIALIIYFRYSKFHLKGFLGVAALAGLVYLVIHMGIINGAPKLARMININPAAVSFPLALFLMLAIFLGLFFLFGKIFRGKASLLKWSRMLAIGMILVTVGYSSYEMIFIRSLKDPRIDENDPETVAAAVSYLEREQYGQHSWSREDAIQQSRTSMQYKGPFDFFWSYQFKQMYVRYFNWQYMGRAEGGGVGWSGAGVDLRKLWALPFLIGILGAFFHFNKDWKRAFPVLVLFLMTGLAIVLYVNNPDPQPRERDYSYVGSFYTFALWIGVGAMGILETVNRLIKKKKLRDSAIVLVSVLLLVALPLNMLQANYRSHNRWGNYVASDYAYNLLNSCEENAILFTNGDNDTFPLWYMQEVENFRKDVKVVNLSLLNTPWYIKQLKNIEPVIPLRWSDAQIETIRPIPWKEQEVNISGLEITVKPTYGGQYLRVQDLMIIELIQVIDWKRPIYFAATVSNDSRVNLDEYLAMEGQVLRLYPHKVEFIDKDKIHHNFTSNYRFRNLNNPKVYFDPNTKRLMQNYRTAALQASLEYLNSGDTTRSMELLKALDQKIPESIIPQYHPEMSLQTGRIYFQLGDTAEYQRRIDEALGKSGLDERTLMVIAQELIYSLEDYDRAEKILLPVYQRDPYNNWAAGSLVRIYRETGRYDRALELLDNWLRVSPNDHQARALKTQIEAMANE